jgi:hypothetical protein
MRAGAWWFAVTALASVLLTPDLAQAQTPGGSVLHLTGQTVQPVYEGFEQNADGTYTMWFGYMNRNFEERPHIPVGSDNFFQITERLDQGGPVDRSRTISDPGPLDRGQPTHSTGGRTSSSRSPSRRISGPRIWCGRCGMRVRN